MMQGLKIKILKNLEKNAGNIISGKKLYRFIFVIRKNHFIGSSRHDFLNYPRQTWEPATLQIKPFKQLK